LAVIKMFSNTLLPHYPGFPSSLLSQENARYGQSSLNELCGGRAAPAKLRASAETMETNSALRSLIISRVRDQARQVRSFDLMPEGAEERHGVSFVPGQVAVLLVEGEAPAYFAFASAPEDPELEVLVKQKVGASNRIFEMREGERIELMDVTGHGFALDEQRGKDLVFVAMGTGVAPLRSALRHVLTRKEEFGRCVVLYGARTPDDFCFRDETDGWKDAGVELRQVISRPDGHDWSGPTGYVQSLLDHVLPDLNSPVALICGSPEMIDQTRGRLEQMGFRPEEILTNY
jgi:sulfhydrogenase subunit gamma (sulfur reductase)